MVIMSHFHIPKNWIYFKLITQFLCFYFVIYLSKLNSFSSSLLLRERKVFEKEEKDKEKTKSISFQFVKWKSNLFSFFFFKRKNNQLDLMSVFFWNEIFILPNFFLKMSFLWFFIKHQKWCCNSAINYNKNDKNNLVNAKQQRSYNHIFICLFLFLLFEIFKNWNFHCSSSLKQNVLLRYCVFHFPYFWKF